MNTMFLMMVGYSLSGKTWFVNTLLKKFPKTFFLLETRSVHDFLNNYDIFQDDNSIEGRAFDMRQEATNSISESLLKVVLKSNYSVVSDSCNRKLDERTQTLSKIKKEYPNIKTMIIYVNTDFETILKRARVEDDALREAKRKPVWEELHMKQRESFNIPTKNEVDYFFEYDGKNEEDVVKEIGEVLGA